MKLQFDTDEGHEIFVYVNDQAVSPDCVTENQYCYMISDDHQSQNLEVLCVQKGKDTNSLKTKYRPRYFKAYKAGFKFLCWQGTNDYGHFNRVIHRVNKNAVFHGKFTMKTIINCWGIGEDVLALDEIKSKGVELAVNEKAFGRAGAQINRRCCAEMILMLLTRLVMLTLMLLNIKYDWNHRYEQLSRSSTGLKLIVTVDIPLLLIHIYQSVYFSIQIFRERKRHLEL